jgi:hypothetical protein
MQNKINTKTIRQQKQKHYHNLNNVKSILWLAEYYERKNNIKQMLKFYKKASKKKDINSMIKLAEYYVKNENDEKVEKYYDMAILSGNYKKIIELLEYNIRNDDFNKWNIQKISYLCDIFWINYKFFSKKSIKKIQSIFKYVLQRLCFEISPEKGKELFFRICDFCIEKYNDPESMYLKSRYFENHNINKNKILKYGIEGTKYNHMASLWWVGYCYTYGIVDSVENIDEGALYWEKALKIKNFHPNFDKWGYKVIDSHCIYDDKNESKFYKIAVLFLINHDSSFRFEILVEYRKKKILILAK